MKISKLFHWLYALLMLLPAFFVGGRMLYTIFNKNAKDSYYGETINQEFSVSVDENNFLNNFTYVLNFNRQTLDSRCNFYVTNFEVLYYSNPTELDDFDTDGVLMLQFVTTSFNLINEEQQTVSINVPYRSGTFKFYVLSNTYDSSLNGLFSRIEYNKYSYLDNAFTYSMEQLNEVGLFSWAKDSFIVEPFSYITGLFGIEQTSPINTLLSYWCSISVIWLVFDLLMYVPLLVHRWLDKGVLE